MIRLSSWFRAVFLALTIVCTLGLFEMVPALAASGSGVAMAAAPMTIAYLPPGNAITDGRALLRYALPINNDEIRDVQENLEGLSEWLRSKRWGPIKRDVLKVERTLNRKGDRILADVPEQHRATAEAAIERIKAGIVPIRDAADAKDREAIWIKRGELLEDVTEIEELMVTEFPFEVPEEYSHLPQLKGRATIEFETNRGTLTAVVDGYSAPVTAGNFVDLVQRGFYDDMPFTRAEDFYVLQTGDPAGPAEGFIDPKTDEYRAIPLEILVQGDDAPIYGATLEYLGRYMDDPVLPFSAFGTLGMARPNDDANGASSQFFFFLFEPELTPAGLNLLDGRYAVFGYVVENKELLEDLTQGDRIVDARVVSGLENLQEPT
ncbi:peptidylprolyl isomerase [filamentous cyanobacterium CCP5]|nr:peptidylprolyl isomerase [filamentous cyanobacterium CCP5]